MFVSTYGHAPIVMFGTTAGLDLLQSSDQTRTIGATRGRSDWICLNV